MSKDTNPKTKGRKMKVLVVPSDRTGVGYYRSTNPHILLEQNYPDEFQVDIDYKPNLDDDEWLSQYDLIHYHRVLGDYHKMPETLKRLKDLGIVSVMDLDDYWSPGKHHPSYHMIKNSGVDKLILDNVKISQHVTTTTPLFAKEIGKFNKNVHVIPNAINPDDNQFKPNPEPSDRIRIGWLGGSSHLKDLEILRGLVNKLKSDNLLDKVQFVLCGFDTNGTMTIIDKKTGKRTRRAIQPNETVWYKYEKIFTDDYKIVSPEYKSFLLKFENTEFEGINNEPYRRVWTKSINDYATNYNLFDISLAPLDENLFNKVKSQLKVIEAGFHKKALIAQDFGPYQLDLVNYFNKPKSKRDQVTVNDEGNALLVSSSKNHKDWYRNIKKLITNPELIVKLADNLHKTVKNTYDANTVTNKRRDLYLDLINKGVK